MRTLFPALFAVILASCASYDTPASAEGTVLSMAGVRPGSGVIDSIGVLRKANSGKAAGARDPNAYRLYLRMDVGGFQSVDVDNSSFSPGEFVEITNDGRVVRVSGTTLGG